MKDRGVVCEASSGDDYVRIFFDRAATLIHIETSEVFADLCERFSLAVLQHIDENERFILEPY
ncbi:hypothetical protein [Nitrospira sp. Ecomares 2.1]